MVKLLSFVFVVLNTVGRISFFALSDRGLVRETNEDYFAHIPEKGIFILADGMGGHNAGEVASRLASETLIEYMKSIEIKEPLEILKEAFSEANRAVYQLSQKEISYFGMGTTLDCLCIHGEKASFAHVGDSRIYRLKKDHLSCLTRDQTLVNELISLGAITEEEAQLFPLKQTLTQAVGTHPYINPEIGQVQIEREDLLLLCSDGLTNYVREEEIKEILLSNRALSEKASKLIEKAKEHGGGDNITCQLISIDDLP